MRLKDKVVIVTGGAMGIGKTLAIGLAKEGAHIVVADITDKTDEVVTEIAALARRCLAVKVDITKRDEVQEMVERTMAEFGIIDILVNNAAIYPFAPFLECTDEMWNQVIAVGLNGTFICSQIVAREMVKKKSGKIINISSTQGLLGIPLTSPYTAVKGAIVALTREMATELSPLGINVNCLAPGLTQTEHCMSVIPKELADYLGSAAPIRRLGKPGDYVGMVTFLASDESCFATGATFCVDGGVGSTMLVPAG